VTRFGLVVKKQHFSPQIGDENTFRRQKLAFFSPKWRRDSVSSSKLSVFHLKMVTRMGLVVKKWGFPLQNGDENGSRRQKQTFYASKW
jgi:hypothetical protein